MNTLTMFAMRLGFAALSFLLFQAGQAATVTLAWDPSPTPQVTYNLYISTSGGAFTFVANTPQMTYTMNYDNTKTNAWYVTARNSTGVESVPSNTVQLYPATVPPPVFGLAFEAEAGTLTAPWSVVGTYIQHNAEVTTPSAGGRAAYVFSVTNAGNYTISMLANSLDGASDSVWVNVDTEPTDPANYWSIPLTSGFETRTVAWTGSNETNAHTFTFAAGNHTLIIRGREANVKIDRIMVTPVSVPPPTGAIAISTPTLNNTTFTVGQTITATAYVTNKTTSPWSLTTATLTARQPGANNQTGPFDDFNPSLGAQTMAVNAVLTLTASWVVRSDAPLGSWTCHFAVKGGPTNVYTDGPTTPFTVTSPVPNPPLNLRIN